MSRKKTNLSKNEWAIMSVLWDCQRPLVLSEIIAEMKDTVDWGYSTYQTQLRRLAQSGYLNFETRGHNRFFWPAVNRDECIMEEVQGIRDRLTPDVSNKLLLCMLREAEGLSPDEAAELNRLAGELAKREG